MARTWIEIIVDVPSEHLEAVANFLIEAGAPGIISEEKLSRAAVTGHFDHAPPVAAIQRYCAELGCADARIDTRVVEEENWAENWKAYFTPVLVGDRLFVCPPWAAQPHGDRIGVVINPGMAFGTGHHASTLGCLELLEAVVRQHSITLAMDVGTGSGILAIALAKLGVPSVIAADVDPAALEIAHDNVSANQVGAAVELVANWENRSDRCDLVVANLFANLLVERSADLLALVKPGGRLICSGFVNPDAGRVQQAFEELGATCVSRWERDGWVALEFRVGHR